MDNDIEIFIESKVKPTLVTLYTEVVQYLTDINYLEENEELRVLIDRSIANEVDNETEELESILRGHLLTIASTYGIVLNRGVVTIRLVFDILKAIDGLNDIEVFDRLYIIDVLDSDISSGYKLVNILTNATKYTNVILSDLIDDCTTTLLDNIRIMVDVAVEEEDMVDRGVILQFLVDLDKEISIGAKAYNHSHSLDTTIEEIVSLYWNMVDIDKYGVEIYSLLILGRDSRFDIESKFDTVFTDLVDETILNRVKNTVTELESKHRGRVLEIFRIDDEVE